MKRKNRALIIIPAITAAFAVFTAMSLTGCDNNTVAQKVPDTEKP